LLVDSLRKRREKSDVSLMVPVADHEADFSYTRRNERGAAPALRDGLGCAFSG